MMRRLALSYWTPVALGVALLGLHLAWAIRWEPTKRAEIVTAYGAWLVVLAILVAARPYIRTGLTMMTHEASPLYVGDLSGIDFTPPTPEQIAQEEARSRAKHAQARRDIVAERIVAVVVVIVGTLLNGYGAPLVRWLGLEVQL